MTETNCANGSRECASRPGPAAPGRKGGTSAGRGLRLAGVIALLLLAGAVLWIEINSWRRMQALHGDFTRANLDSFYLGIHLREGIERMNSALYRQQLSRDDSGLDRSVFETEAADLATRIQRTKALLATPEERALVNTIETNYLAYVAESAPYLERSAGPIRKHTPAIVHQELTARAAPLLELAARLVDTQHAALGQFMNSSRGALASLQLLLPLSLLLFLLFAVAAATLLARAVIVPLRARLDASEVIIQRQEKLAALGALAAGVAHEIRNPLTAIRLHLFSLKRSLPEGFEHQEDFAVISQDLTRLDRILHDFLQFARPADPQLAAVPVAPLVRDVQQLLGVELDGRRIQLRTEVDAGLTLRADRAQVQQVLINLIRNAADSIGEDGVIAVSARPAPSGGGAGVELDVSDTGRGIAPEHAGRIFDPFFSTKDHGTGLGLAIASRIMEKHGGQIRFAPHEPRGTTFTLTFPGANPDEPTTAVD